MRRNNSYYNQGVNAGIASSNIHIVEVYAGDIRSQLPSVWNTLSTDNFFTRIDYIYGSSESDGTGGGSTSYNQNFTMSYDSSSGVLTVDGTSATGNTYHDNGTGSTRGEAGVHYSIWCVY